MISHVYLFKRLLVSNGHNFSESVEFVVAQFLGILLIPFNKEFKTKHHFINHIKSKNFIP